MRPPPCPLPRRPARGLPLLALCLLLGAACGDGPADEPFGEVIPGPDSADGTSDAEELRRPPGTLAPSALQVSASATRTGSVGLTSSTLKGGVAIFVNPPAGSTVQYVEFYVDDPQRQRAPLRTETGAPFDLAGTAGDGSATPYDTRQLRDGVHSLTALVRYQGRESDVGTAQFTVANAATATPVPVADAGTAPRDAGTVTADAGTRDAGTAPRDAGTVTPDAGTVTRDAGTVTPDAGTAPPPTGGGTTLPPPSPTGPGYAAVRNGRIEVDGQPFFPHGYYYVSWGHTSTQLITNLRTIAAAGFNAVHGSYEGGTNYAAFLDEAQRLGLKVITEGAPNDVVSQLKGKWAVLGWNIGDDVHDSLTPTALATRHQAAKAADPNHFTYFTVYAPSKWGTFLDKGDVVAPYNYPVSSSSLGDVDYAMNLARSAGRPMIGIPQAFMWSGQRAPTAAELRNMVYQNLVNNVRGLIYYNFSEGELIPTKHPELWNATKAMVPEVNRLAPALTQGTYTKLANPADRVVGATWKLGTQLYVVVVNTHETESRTVSIPLTATGSAQALFSGRPAGLFYSGGRLAGSIGPRDVHVYLLPTQ